MALTGVVRSNGTGSPSRPSTHGAVLVLIAPLCWEPGTCFLTTVSFCTIPSHACQQCSTSISMHCHTARASLHPVAPLRILSASSVLPVLGYHLPMAWLLHSRPFLCELLQMPDAHQLCCESADLWRPDEARCRQHPAPEQRPKNDSGRVPVAAHR